MIVGPPLPKEAINDETQDLSRLNNAAWDVSTDLWLRHRRGGGRGRRRRVPAGGTLARELPATCVTTGVLEYDRIAPGPVANPSFETGDLTGWTRDDGPAANAGVQDNYPVSGLYDGCIHPTPGKGRRIETALDARNLASEAGSGELRRAAGTGVREETKSDRPELESSKVLGRDEVLRCLAGGIRRDRVQRG